MATLGLVVSISIVITTEDRWAGEPDGMTVPPMVLFGMAGLGERLWYWVASAPRLLTEWLSFKLIESPTGRALRALHG